MSRFFSEMPLNRSCPFPLPPISTTIDPSRSRTRKSGILLPLVLGNTNISGNRRVIYSIHSGTTHKVQHFSERGHFSVQRAFWRSQRDLLPPNLPTHRETSRRIDSIRKRVVCEEQFCRHLETRQSPQNDGLPWMQGGCISIVALYNLCHPAEPNDPVREGLESS